jgi:hypothetical protein
MRADGWCGETKVDSATLDYVGGQVRFHAEEFVVACAREREHLNCAAEQRRLGAVQKDMVYILADIEGDCNYRQIVQESLKKIDVASVSIAYNRSQK